MVDLDKIYKISGPPGFDELLKRVREAPVPSELHAALEDIRKRKLLAKAMPAVLAGLKSDDPYARRNAVEALIYLAEKGEKGVAAAVPNLIDALASPASRGDVARAFGVIKDDRTVPALIELLNDPSPYVRSVAVESLGHLKDVRSVPALMDSLVRDQDKRVRLGAAIALGEIGQKKAAKPLTRALLDDVDPLVRMYAAAALGNIGDKSPATIEALIRALRDPEVDVIRNAIGALTKLKAGEAVEPYLSGLATTHANKYVREDAAFSLGVIGDPRAEGALRTLLKDEAESVRENARVALTKLRK